MSTESDRALRFRCAETGRRFIVVFHRPSPLIRFVVVNVVDEAEFAPKKPTRKAKAPKLLEDQPNPSRKVLPALLDIIPTVRRFFSGLADSKPDPKQAVAKAPPQQTTKTAPSEKREQQPPPRGKPGGQYGDAYDISEFSFNGWYCPCCGHAKESKPQNQVVPYGKKPEPSIQFVRCSKCHEYVCGSRITTLPDGRHKFTCHDKCGHSGIIGEGTLSSMSGMGLDQKKPALLDELASRQLNPGTGPRQLRSGSDDNGTTGTH